MSHEEQLATLRLTKRQVRGIIVTLEQALGANAAFPATNPAARTLEALDAMECKLAQGVRG